MKDTLGDTPYVHAYPVSPGFKEPTTSQDAAIRIAPCASTVREMALASLRIKPGTADEIAARLELSILTVRPRFSELAKHKQIERTGTRRKNSSGMSAAEWRARGD